MVGEGSSGSDSVVAYVAEIEEEPRTKTQVHTSTANPGAPIYAGETF